MASLLNDPKKLVAVDLQNWLDKDESRTLNLNEWRERGPYQLVREGITQATYDYVIKNGFPPVRGLINQLKKSFRDAPKREKTRELNGYEHEYEELRRQSEMDDQRKMIIYLKMRNQSNHDIALVLKKSEGFVKSEFERMKSEGWCGL